MPSVGTVFSQPRTKSYAVTQANQGAYFYSQADIDNWYNANKSKITKLGSLYIIPGTTSGSTFIDVLLGNNGATELDHTLNDINERKAITDMGKEVIVGNKVNSRLLVLRRVQQYFNAADGGASDPDYTGYVVVENNADDLQGNTGRFTVRVARV